MNFGKEFNAAKSVALALLIYFILGYLVYGVVQDFSTIAIAIIIMCGTAHYITRFFQADSLYNLLIIGSLSYISYDVIVIFFKITTEAPIISEELLSALIFGGGAAASYWLLKKYIEI